MPRKTEFVNALLNGRIGTSMRPGLNAPENAKSRYGDFDVHDDFNEAGAECPGKPGDLGHVNSNSVNFNEAGAECPGKQYHSGRVRCGRTHHFNEAGAECPGKREGSVSTPGSTSTLQ